MSSPFAMMAGVLTSLQPVPAAFHVDRSGINRCNGKTEALRMALDQGSFTALELASIASLPNSGLVYALLKSDINKGRVELVEGLYRRVVQ